MKAATKTEAGGADEWTTFLESETAEIRARPTEPIADVASILALNTVTEALANVTISAEEDVKTERVRLKELCAQLGSLVTRVVEQKSSSRWPAFKPNKGRGKKVEKEKEEVVKQDEAEKKKQEAKKRLAKAAAHAAGQKCQVMVAYDDCDQIEKVSESGFSKTNDRLEPAIVTMCVANDSWKAEHDKSMDEFTKKTPESLRGAKQMIEKRAEAKVALEPVTIFSNDAVKESSSVEKTYLQSPWMFAYGPGMKSC